MKEGKIDSSLPSTLANKKFSKSVYLAWAQSGLILSDLSNDQMQFKQTTLATVDVTSFCRFITDKPQVDTMECKTSIWFLVILTLILVVPQLLSDLLNLIF